LRQNLRRIGGRYYWHWDPKFIDNRSYERALYEERLSAAARHIRIPTLLIRGGESDLITQEHVDSFLRIIPTAEFTEVRGAGHMVAGDRNDRFNAVVVNFLLRMDARQQP
jgi:pimeloyl-ACP methyl ester carboxylesterase